MQSRSFILFVLAGVMLASVRTRAQDTHRDQIAAANWRALEDLRAQVSAEPIANGVTVADLLNKTRSTRTLMKTLARAQQIGGPRWLDADTCQVRLEIGGPVIARALYDIAAHDNRTPVEPIVVQKLLVTWNERTFSATGTSTGAAAVETAMADKARRQAVCDARRDAVAQVLQTVRPVPLGAGHTVADALADPKVKEPVEKWLNERPVTQIEFREEHQARVTLAVAGDELFDTFHAAAAKQPNATGAMDDAAWARVRDDFVSRVGPAAGRAMAEATTAPSAIPIALPSAPPDWIDRQLDAEGSSPAKSTRLKAARAAESEATDKLRAQIEPLAIAPGLTLGEAIKRDKQIALAVDRALIRARTTKVDYRSDGGARVVVTLDLKDLWQEIQSP
jgi:hypothetical protein